MATDTWTIKRMLDWSAPFLSRYGSESPRLDAELLLCDTLGLSRMDLYVQFDRPIEGEELARYKGLIKRRAGHEPVAYILGSKGFHAIDLKVGPGVLVPRPETEHLVDVALAFLRDPESPRGPVVDVGTGSGAIILAVATGLDAVDAPPASAAGAERRAMIATDRDATALRFARENAENLGLQARVKFVQGDLMTPAMAFGPYAALLSNPPYIRSDAMPALAPTVRDHEPHIALDGGPGGLDLLERLVNQAPGALLPGGLFAVELGSRQQGEQVATWLAARGFVDATYNAIGPGPTGIVRAIRGG